MRTWIKQTCKFCDKELEGFLPECDCEGWQAAEAERQAEWDEAHKDDPPEEDFEKTYPLIFDGRSEVCGPEGEEKTGDCIAVDARKYKDGIGICIYMPFWDAEEQDWDSSGLCFDLPEELLIPLRQLLDRAQEEIDKSKEK